jgi:hypothetical protein
MPVSIYLLWLVVQGQNDYSRMMIVIINCIDSRAAGKKSGTPLDSGEQIDYPVRRNIVVPKRRFRIQLLEGYMKVRLGVVVAGLGLLAGSVPVFAHHSFAAEYDSNKPVNITGTVTKVEWMNPHARFYVDVKGADGKVTNWNFELGAIPVLLKQGWTKNSLKEGDKVTVEGSAAKDSSNSANARSVKLADGRRVFGGSSAPDAQNQ